MTNNSCESVVGVLDQVASHHERSQHPTTPTHCRWNLDILYSLGWVPYLSREELAAAHTKAHHKGRSMQSAQKQQLEKYNTNVLHLFTKTELREFAADCAPLDGEDTGTMNKEPLVAMLSQ